MRPSYGYATPNSAPEIIDARSQQRSLEMLVMLARRASVTPLLHNTALKIIGEYGCRGREDDCELQSVFDTLKRGNGAIPPFKNGYQYVADPRYADYFKSPVDIINNCMKGACGGDCDDHTGLIMALLGSIGWKVGARAWGPKNATGYSHVYAVVAYPKKPDDKTGKFSSVVALDTTVPDSEVGWEPPRGNVLTAWMD